jgi:hypothetical protein
MQEEISSLQDICGIGGCPLIGQSQEQVLSPLQTPKTIDSTFILATNILRFLIYLSVPVFLITILVSLIIVTIKLIKKQKGVGGYLIIMAICIIGLLLSIYEVTAINLISALQQNSFIGL